MEIVSRGWRCGNLGNWGIHRIYMWLLGNKTIKFLEVTLNIHHFPLPRLLVVSNNLFNPMLA
jgi:hypothetical protein